MAGLGDRVADGDLVKFPEELLLFHPKLALLQLGQQLSLVRRIHPAPTFAPGGNLSSAQASSESWQH